MTARKRPILVRRGGANPATSNSEVSLPKHLPGQRIECRVTGFDDGEVVVEWDGRRAFIDASEFNERPASGAQVAATFLIHDPSQDADVLTSRSPRSKVTWDKLAPGDLVGGAVTEVNTGGLVINLGKIRGFLPLSQLGSDLRKAAGALLRQEVAGVVTRFDKRKKEVVLGLRSVLGRFEKKAKARQYSRFQEGQRIEGKIVRTNEHGAFIDLGGVDGLLHISKIERHNQSAETPVELEAGSMLTVQILYVDTDRSRIGLGFPRAAGRAVTSSALSDFEVGEQVMGMIRGIDANGFRVMLDERLEGWIPKEAVAGWEEPPTKGQVVKATISSLEQNRIHLDPIEAPRPPRITD